MKLSSLQLENFRNYRSYSYKFNDEKNVTILLGPNGKGKTNFLEAIYVLSLGKSFRSIMHGDMIEWEMDYMRCKGTIIQDDEEVELEVFYSITPRKSKNFKKNDVNLKNSEYMGNLLTVLFHPEDLNMLYLSPSLRRRYMNILLSQTDRKYLYALSKYNKILKQRNVLLGVIREARFGGRDTTKLKEDLDAWDTQIVEFGSQIIAKRIALVKFLIANLEKIYRSISSKKETIELIYDSKIVKRQFPAEEEIAQLYRDELFNRMERDTRSTKTSAGPHRDDLKFLIDGKDISSAASRGEFRTLLLAIKIAEIEFIKEKTGRNPILLLDDVFSELDRKRQGHLLKCIKNCQTIITTTDLENLKDVQEKAETITLVELE